MSRAEHRAAPVRRGGPASAATTAVVREDGHGAAAGSTSTRGVNRREMELDQPAPRAAGAAADAPGEGECATVPSLGPPSFIDLAADDDKE